MFSASRDMRPNIIHVLLSSALCVVTVGGTYSGIDSIINSLDNIIQYMSTHSTDTLPDFNFGVILAKGQIHVLLSHLEQGECALLSPEERIALIDELNDLDNKSDVAVRRSSENVKVLGTDIYYATVRKLLQPEKWEVDQEVLSGSLESPEDSRNITLSPTDISNLRIQYAPDEASSDHCIGEILGMTGPPCFVSDYCRKIILRNIPTIGYGLTHRLLYLQVARQFGCQPAGSPREMRNKIKEFCSNILKEAYKIENTNFPPGLVDLFAEQVALCGMEGFEEFFNSMWVQKMLSWQKPLGCFSWIDEPRSRYKREERLMTDGCLMHFTGVTAAALAVSLRLAVQCPVDSISK